MSQTTPQAIENPADLTVAEAYGEVLKRSVNNVNTDEELDEIYSVIDELVENSKYGPQNYVGEEYDPEEIIDMHSSAMDW